MKEFHQWVEGGDSSFLHIHGEISSGVVCLDLGCSVQERHGQAVAKPVKGHKDAEETVSFQSHGTTEFGRSLQRSSSPSRTT